ncbi:ribosome-inactivating family protein [Streptomyces sp. NPDC002276]
MSHSDTTVAPEPAVPDENAATPGKRAMTRGILRRLRLPAACAALVAGAVLLSGLSDGTPAGNATSGQAHSVRLDSHNVRTAASGTPVFYYNGNRWDYFGFLNAIKENLNAYNNTVPGTSSTVNHTPRSDSGFFDVIVIDSHNNALQMKFRRSDLYLVGWFTQAHTYNYIGPAGEAGIPPGYTGAPANGQGGSWQLTNSPSYGSLEKMAGTNRGQISFSEPATGAAAANLRSAGHRELMAQGILYFTQFISEAVRFRGISDTIGWDAYGDRSQDNHLYRTRIDAHFLDQETQWGQDSQRFNWMLSARQNDSWNNHFQGWYMNTAGRPTRIDMITAADYARVLAMALGYPGNS